MQERFKTFTTLIANINRSIKKIKTEEMSKFNLKSVHVSCLYYLYKQKGLTVGELCEMCDEDKANVSRSVEYLEDRGYVEKRLKNSKRYKTPIELTESGEEMGEMIARKIDKVLTEVSVDVSDEEREIMYKMLDMISSNLQKICDNYEEE